MSYWIAGIDVHKRMVAVVAAEVGEEGVISMLQRTYSTMPESLRKLSDWMAEQEVQEIVMESTAQYWKPVWEVLERFWSPRMQSDEPGVQAMAGKLYLAKARSNRAPGGRKNDMADAQRLVRRHLAGELELSFVPEPEQRLLRSISRRRLQLIQDRVRLQNQIESSLEECHIKLSSWLSDLLGQSGRRILNAIAEGKHDVEALAALADRRVRATQEQLCDALSPCSELNPAHRMLLKQSLKMLDLLDEQVLELDRGMSTLLAPHQDAVQRLAEVPGIGVQAAHQIIAEVGVTAATFPSPKCLASWVGICPGSKESAGVNQSSRSPKGNVQMRRILTQAAQGAVRSKGTIFELAFETHRRHGQAYQEAVWSVGHRLCRLVWKILHQGVRYEERGPAVQAKVKRQREARMIKELRRLGYTIERATPTEQPTV